MTLLYSAAVFALTASLASLAAGAQAPAVFGGAPPLGPADALRQAFKPYDLVKLNYLGANYCENLLDMRLNTTSYTHLGLDSCSSDAWHLQFPDDAARFLEAIAWEDQFSPIVRLELARRLVKGMLAAHVPGTRAESYFRHRSGGKTFLIFDDRQANDGRVMLSNWGDDIQGAVKVGFRVRKGGEWHGPAAFRRSDEPAGAGDPGVARSANAGRYWNESPFVFRRTYTSDAGSIVFTGRYWLSDEDKPLEFGFDAPGAEALQTVIGDPGAPMPLLGDYRITASVHLPDRKTVIRSDRDGDRTFESPDFRYLIVRRPAAWGATGYSAALLVMWDRKPQRVEAIADKGYGEVRITWAGTAGRVSLYPYYWLDDRDIEAVHRSAEQFLATGRLLQNGFPSQQLLNAIPAGLAAGAYLLTRYKDPLAQTARVNAARAVDALFAAEDDGKRLIRVFFTVRAAAWMVKMANELGSKETAVRYRVLLDRAVRRMRSPETGYDGKGWPGGWDHFNSAKALWLAYDATGDPEYGRAFDLAATVYTIDKHGIYRYGQRIDAPGGFDTYSGTMPLALWGNAGRLDWVETLINLDVPNGWHEPKRPVRDTWNDAGAGPWAQDDANPEYVGFSLRGARIPQRRKVILPVGAFPVYSASGEVRATRLPILRNPFFLPGIGRARTIPGPSACRPPRITETALVPGSRAEASHMVGESGRVGGGARVCTGHDAPLLYRFDTAGASGAGLDLRIKGDGYRVEVSPDGRRWFERLDTWDDAVADQSLDLSFLTGSREELLRMQTIAPPDDSAYLVGGSSGAVEREHCRYATSGHALTYRFDLPDVAACWLEILVGNGYEVECSGDGRAWRPGLSSQDVDGGSGKGGADAAFLRMLDVSPYLGRSHRVYVRVTDAGNAAGFGGRRAFLRRIALYGVLKSRQIWVRISNVSSHPDRSFTLARVTFRTW